MRLRRKIGSALAACGIVLIISGVGALPALGAEPQIVALQPSPRPAIEPVGQAGGNGVQMGHVTGTVIDQRTGAPAPGITVRVGDATVTSDANGNYDHWVALSLSPAQGEAVQGAVTVTIQPNSATIQHLSFISPAPATSVVAGAPAAAPKLVPTVHADAAPTPAVDAPKRLPRTGSEGSPAWMWLAAGMLLLMAGSVVGFAPVINGRSAAALLRTQVANVAFLRTLLAQPPVDEFLTALIERHERNAR
jgi:LPXTG-motif cell wall-anchored protein